MSRPLLMDRLSAPWVSSIGIVLGGAVLLGIGLLLIGAVRAATYSGVGDAGVFTLLTVGFPLAGWSALALLLFVGAVLVRRRLRAAD